MLRPLLLAALCLAGRPGPARGCQLPSEWRPLSEGCRAELAEIIVYAKVLALHQEVPGLYNYLPWQYEASDAGLFYSAEIEMLCDQAWGSMLEVPAGSRLNLTGLGYFSCHSHTVVQDYSYFFFLRMDENYNLLPHGVNFQDAIFPDTQENRRMFSSLFQFSNCSQGQQLVTFSSDWEIQEDNRPASLARFLPCLTPCQGLDTEMKMHFRGLDCPGESQMHHVINLTVDKIRERLHGSFWKNQEGFTGVTFEPRLGK